MCCSETSVHTSSITRTPKCEETDYNVLYCYALCTVLLYWYTILMWWIKSVLTQFLCSHVVMVFIGDPDSVNSEFMEEHDWCSCHQAPNFLGTTTWSLVSAGWSTVSHPPYHRPYHKILCYVVAALDQETSCWVLDTLTAPPADNKYTDLKQRLLTTLVSAFIFSRISCPLYLHRYFSTSFKNWLKYLSFISISHALFHTVLNTYVFSRSIFPTRLTKLQLLSAHSSSASVLQINN